MDFLNVFRDTSNTLEINETRDVTHLLNKTDFHKYFELKNYKLSERALNSVFNWCTISMTKKEDDNIIHPDVLLSRNPSSKLIYNDIVYKQGEHIFMIFRIFDNKIFNNYMSSYFIKIRYYTIESVNDNVIFDEYSYEKNFRYL